MKPVGCIQDHTKGLPQTDRPEAFGQHFNAGITYQQQESQGLLDSLAAMQSQSAANPAADDRQQVIMVMATRLAAQVNAIRVTLMAPVLAVLDRSSRSPGLTCVQ